MGSAAAAALLLPYLISRIAFGSRIPSPESHRRADPSHASDMMSERRGYIWPMSWSLFSSLSIPSSDLSDIASLKVRRQKETCQRPNATEAHIGWQRPPTVRSGLQRPPGSPQIHERPLAEAALKKNVSATGGARPAGLEPATHGLEEFWVAAAFTVDELANSSQFTLEPS